jgi:TIR domain/PsbP
MGEEIFISYSSKNKVIADAVCHKLEERKMRCWIAPRDILPGTNYAEELIHAIDNSKLFVLIFSKDSDQSQHVLRECERAVSRGIPIVPFRIEDVLPGAALQYFIGPQHWLDAVTAPCAAHIDRLADTVNILLTHEDLTQKSAGEMLAEAEALAVRRKQQVVRMRRTSIVLAAVVVILVAAVGGWFFMQQANQASLNLVPYVNQAAGFQLQVPQGWAKDGPSSVAGLAASQVKFYLPTNNKDEAVLVMNASAKGNDFDNVTAVNLENAYALADNKQITILESGETSLGGPTAYKLVYTQPGSPELKTMQIWTVKNDTIYQFTYNTETLHYNDYFATVQKMVDSFRLI